MQESNREPITEVALIIKVIAEADRYEPIQIAGLAGLWPHLARETLDPGRTSRPPATPSSPPTRSAIRNTHHDPPPIALPSIP